MSNVSIGYCNANLVGALMRLQTASFNVDEQGEPFFTYESIKYLLDFDDDQTITAKMLFEGLQERFACFSKESGLTLEILAQDDSCYDVEIKGDVDSFEFTKFLHQEIQNTIQRIEKCGSFKSSFLGKS